MSQKHGQWLKFKKMCTITCKGIKYIMCLCPEMCPTGLSEYILRHYLCMFLYMSLLNQLNCLNRDPYAERLELLIWVDDILMIY